MSEIPDLSILIPSIPGREMMRHTLMCEIDRQVRMSGADVEILCLIDNRKRTVGEKRQALLNCARGWYVSFLDDDDLVMPDYVELICQQVEKAKRKVDVILFDSLCTVNGIGPVRVHHAMDNPDEEFNPKGFRRGSWHIHAWRRDMVHWRIFPPTNYGEDIDWLRQVRPHVRSHVKIDAALYHYRFDSRVTATQ